MITIIENKTYYNRSFYKIEYTSADGNLSSTETVDFKISVIKDTGKEKNTSFMLYDNEMKPIDGVFYYVNIVLSQTSCNTRIKAINALKFFYLFLYITKTSLTTFSQADITNLQYFLKGYSLQGITYNLKLLTTRTNKTINDYFSVYRGFLNYLEIDSPAFFEKGNHLTHLNSDYTENGFTVRDYKSNLQIAHPVSQTHKYICVQDFKNIIQEIRLNYSMREEVIVRLMYQGGLRIGEVLGLTFDDVLLETIQEKHTPMVYIRNRYSDNKDQQAKTCMSALHPKVYKTQDYHTQGYGYQTITVPLDLYELINDYIDNAHAIIREKRRAGQALADRVRPSEMYEEANYYIFINTRGRPLSAQLWNITLRRIFKSVGLSIDCEHRKTNLNHRFRHGFAMFYVQALKYDALRLQKLMRHRSLSSVLDYYNPTIEDQITLKNDFTRDLYSLFPKLSEDNE